KYRIRDWCTERTGGENRAHARRHRRRDRLCGRGPRPPPRPAQRRAGRRRVLQRVLLARCAGRDEARSGVPRDAERSLRRDRAAARRPRDPGHRSLRRVPPRRAGALSVVVRLRSPAPGASRRGGVRPHRAVQRRALEGAPRREPRLLPDLDPAGAAAADVPHRPLAAGDHRRQERRLRRGQEVRPRIFIHRAVRQLQGLRRRTSQARAGDPPGAASRRAGDDGLRPSPAADGARDLLDDARRVSAGGLERRAHRALCRGVWKRAAGARAPRRNAAGAEGRGEHAERADRLHAAPGRAPRGHRLGHRQPAQGRGLAGRAELQPHVRLCRYGGPRVNITVIKLGGSLLEDAQRRHAALTKIVDRWKSGESIVLVHGGGKHIDAALSVAGIAKKTHAGLRITDDATLQIVVSVLGGTVNKMLVAELTKLGVRAAGISGCDGDTLVAEQHPPIDGVDLGHVGRVTMSNRTLVRTMLTYGMLPVVSSLAMSTKGALLNVNADSAASAIAVAHNAKELLFLTDVAGLLDQQGSVVPELDATGVEEMIANGIATGGMRPKLESALAALRGGVAQITIGAPATAQPHDCATEGG